MDSVEFMRFVLLKLRHSKDLTISKKLEKLYFSYSHDGFCRMDLEIYLCKQSCPYELLYWSYAPKNFWRCAFVSSWSQKIRKIVFLLQSWWFLQDIQHISKDIFGQTVVSILLDLLRLHHPKFLTISVCVKRKLRNSKNCIFYLYTNTNSWTLISFLFYNN